MEFSSLHIDGERVDFTKVWVHLQRPKNLNFARYCLDVPLELAEEVFFSRKSHAASWSDYIWDEITNLGTFVVEGYVENIVRHAKQMRSCFDWVIITIDDVAESSEAIRLSGKAVRFTYAPQAPELKTLE